MLVGMLVAPMGSESSAGTTPCRQLCRGMARACAPARAACPRQARTVARDARAACATPSCRRESRADRRAALALCRTRARRCRTTPIADCRRIEDELAVAGPEALDTCPLTPAPACTELGPDDACRDALHPADAFFWDRLHAGAYEAIPEVLDRLDAALAAHPDDPSLVRHVAWTHIWRIGELARGVAGGADLAASLAATRPAFARANVLNPGDARVLGFLAGITLAEGIIRSDPALFAKGTDLFADGIAAWPEFNLFSASYILSQLPAESPEFQLALEQQWRNIDLCAGAVVDRRQPDLVATFARTTPRGRLRACWNSWIAPFNVQGFLLNLGDMLVKDGQVATGVTVYEGARQVDGYDRWPYRAVLERRIVDAAENATLFDRQPPVPGRTTMFSSPHSCTGCHQAR